MIIITGAAGFIGSVLVHHFNQLGEEDILLVDHLEEGEKWLNLRDLKFDSIIPPEELFDHPCWEGKVRAVYHLGACSDTTETDMDFLHANNTSFTGVLFDICTKRKVPYLYASSAATYGDGELGYSDEHKNISKLKPLNKYGWSKQLFDQWALKQAKTPPVWLGIKFFNVFGPQEYHKGKMSSVVYHGFNQLQKDGEIRLFKSYREGYADGGQTRDFVYVKDVCRAMVELMKAAQKKKTLSGIYNLGTGKARTFKDLALATIKASGSKAQVKYIEMPEELRGRYQYYTQADMKKFMKALPKFKFQTLEESVADYVQNHLMKDHPYLEA